MIAPVPQKRILLVEDHEPASTTMTMFLEELGYGCDLAETGLAALDKFAAGGFAMVIMDMQLPDIDGLEAARRIRALEKRENRPPVPIIAATGNAAPEDRDLCLRAGMNDCLSKPFRLADLESKLQNLI